MLEEVMMLGQGGEINLIDQEQRRGRIRACWRRLGQGLPKRRLIEPERDDQHYLPFRRAVRFCENGLRQIVSRWGRGDVIRSSFAFHDRFGAGFLGPPADQRCDLGDRQAEKAGRPESFFRR